METSEPKRYPTAIPLFDELRGERVIVRGYRPGDAEALREAVIESRAHLRPWMPWAETHQTLDETRDWITHSMAHWLLRQSLDVGIWEAASGRYVGGSGFHQPDWDVRAFEIGYWLRASAEGHGYTAETVRLLTDFAFDHLAARRVAIHCDARNQRSANVARRLGFVQEALLRATGLAPDGTVRDTLIFALTPSDLRWPARP